MNFRIASKIVSYHLVRVGHRPVDHRVWRHHKSVGAVDRFAIHFHVVKAAVGDSDLELVGAGGVSGVLRSIVIRDLLTGIQLTDGDRAPRTEVQIFAQLQLRGTVGKFDRTINHMRIITVLPHHRGVGGDGKAT